MKLLGKSGQSIFWIFCLLKLRELSSDGFEGLHQSDSPVIMASIRPRCSYTHACVLSHSSPCMRACFHSFITHACLLVFSHSSACIIYACLCMCMLKWFNTAYIVAAKTVHMFSFQLVRAWINILMHSVNIHKHSHSHIMSHPHHTIHTPVTIQENKTYTTSYRLI